MVQEEEAADRRGRRGNKTMVEALARGRGQLAMCSRPSAINIEAEEAVGTCLAAPSAW